MQAAVPLTGGFNLAAPCIQPASLEAYRWVLLAHSEWRWAVVISGFAVVLAAATRLAAKEAWAPSGPRLGRFFSIAIDVQVLMGAALYLLLSPLSTVVLCTTRMPLPRSSDAHFFALFHPVMMLGAFVGVHLASVIVRRARSDSGRQRRAVIFYGLTLLIVLSAIPWWRPWLRL